MASFPRPLRTLGAMLLVVGVASIAHRGAIEIPFLYTEVGGIRDNAVVADPSTYVSRMLTARGLLQRPLSVLSFTVNRRLNGRDPAGFHVVNGAIHVINALLVLLLARRFFTSGLLAALIFAVHPLSTACVGQIFGRSYSLATTFALLGLLAYATWRRRGPLAPWRAAIIAVLLVLAALTKQSLVAFGAVLAWWSVGPASTETLRPRSRWAPPAIAIAGGGALLLLVGIFVVGYALPLARTAAIPPSTWVWSQLAHVPTMVGFFVLPYQTALVHDLPLYRSPLDRHVVVGALLVAGTVAVAWRYRSHRIPWLLGAIVICLLPTNGVIPRNDLVREWRLYPATVFVALAMGEIVTTLVAGLRRSRHGRWGTPIVVVVTAIWLASLAHTVVLQNRVYRRELDAWRQVVSRYPYSSDAMNNVGVGYLRAGRVELGLPYFALATSIDPSVAVYHENMARAATLAGRPAEAAVAARRAAALRRRSGYDLSLHYADDPAVLKARRLRQ